MFHFFYKRIFAKKELNLDTVIPYTTRPIREGEKDGVEYFFCDEKKVNDLELAGKIIEIDQGKGTVFAGNYTDYVAKKELLKVTAMKAYENQQREIKHQEEVIAKLKSFNREKSIKRAESREKMLNKMEVMDKPTEAKTDMKLTLTPRFLSGNDVLTVKNLAKSFGSLKLFENIDFEIKRGEHVAIIGDNGTGKTTTIGKLANYYLKKGYTPVIKYL